MKETKTIILQEIDRRLDNLYQHEDDEIIQTGNQYAALNQALSKVISAPLVGELESLRDFISQL